MTVVQQYYPHPRRPVSLPPSRLKGAEDIPTELLGQSPDGSGRYAYCETEMFANHPDAAFYVGITALPNAVLMKEEHRALLRLRAKVYVNEKRFLTQDALDHEGAERDIDDDYAFHFGVFENRSLIKPNTAWAVGAGRLILKEAPGQPLPVERFFPDIQAALGSVEASRYIARYPDKRMQHFIGIASIRAMVMYSLAHDIEDVYAVGERSLMRHFNKMGLPFTVLGDPKFISEYQTSNMPLHFNPDQVRANVMNPANPELEAFFKEVGIDQGLGFYDRSLTHHE